MDESGPMPGDCEKKSPVITTKRRKDLLHLAGEMAAWLDQKGILPHERYVFRRMTELMHGGEE